VDLCYNCKLCFIKCPYTPPHKFLIDIPKLVMRARAVEANSDGVELRDKLLSSPDEIGPLASRLAPLVNFANQNRANRVMMEKAIGVHRDKILPNFHAETFERWFKKNIGQAQLVSPASGSERAQSVSPASGSERAQSVSTASGSERAQSVSTASGSERAQSVSTASGSERGDKLKVALFHTCIVNYNEPRIGKAAVRALQKNNVEVCDPQGQRCCGMPYLDAG